jgi:hypothetical protein
MEYDIRELLHLKFQNEELLHNLRAEHKQEIQGKLIEMEQMREQNAADRQKFEKDSDGLMERLQEVENMLT